MTETLMVAFGGNTIQPGTSNALGEQRKNVRAICDSLAVLVSRGYTVVLTHGNGPQIGEIMLLSETADLSEAVSLDTAGAMTQGQMGYMFQQELGNALAAIRCARSSCTVVTQVLVDESDPAFSEPSKPIGRFYSEEEIAPLARRHGWSVGEDSGRGFRRLVPSPEPLSIVEWPGIKALVDAGFLVIAAGGGGVPVMQDERGRLCGVAAVIDKDLAAQRLATLVGASTLVLITAVEAVSIHFGTLRELPLTRVSLREMQDWHKGGEFAEGSMGPKVQAAIRFLQEGGTRAIITSSERLIEAVEGSAGTQIVCEAPVSEPSVITSRQGGRR
ncbi:MAG: carbamate kinase [Chloroflexota bacterium]|nr:carbamate kinase [Chloroflexota bacterium]